ncbi:MAG TPA: hypothetical protein VGB55_15290, partial [Tepidisphaeraceae bacterium]
MHTASSDAAPSLPPSPSSLFDDQHLFYNREISWLDFNDRVLQLAQDPGVPLLERVKFLSIFASNLDEFFMKRIGGLQRQRAAKLSERSLDGLSVDQQLKVAHDRIRPMLEEMYRLWFSELHPALKAEGISIRRHSDLDAD